MKRTTAVFLVSMLVMAFVSGCTPTVSKPSAPPSREESSAAAPTGDSEAETSAGASADAPAETVKIHYFHFMNTPYADQMAKQFELFKAENPGYEIEQEGISGDNYLPILQSRIASGSPPDMWLRSDAGLALGQWVDVAEDLTDQPIWDGVADQAQLEVTYDGRKIAFPFTSNVFGLMYNKKVFENAGITEMPLTLSALKEACEKIKASGVAPFGVGFKDAWCGDQMFRWPFGFDIGGYGEQMKRFDDYLTGKALPSEDSWLGKELDLMTIVKENSQPSPFSTDWNMMCQLLANGEVGMIIQGDWCEAPAREFVPDCDISMALLPFSEDPADAKIFVQYAARTVFVSKDSPNKEGAYQYMKWMVSAPTSIEWYNKDLQVISPFPGIKPEGNAVQLLSTGAELYADPKAVSTWGEYLAPASFFEPIKSVHEEFFADKKDRDAVTQAIDEAAKKYAEANP